MAILKLKSKGDAVKSLQQKLVKLGYKINPDGDFGILTENAVKDFQNTNGLQADGIVGPITMGVIDAQLSNQQINGIDVSQWNGLIDWNKAATTGYKFFILKCSEGETLRDSRFASNYAELKRLGLNGSAYHFYRFFSDPIKQAQNFLAGNFDFKDGKSLPPIIDIEWQDSTGATNAKIIAERATHVANIKTWLNQLENATGRKPMIYTQKSFWDDIVGAPTGFDAYPLWVVDYNLNHTTPVMPSGWTQWTLWQYSSNSIVKGINGNTDMNRFNGSLNAFKKMLK
jgi:lysozyme